MHFQPDAFFSIDSVPGFIFLSTQSNTAILVLEFFARPHGIFISQVWQAVDRDGIVGAYVQKCRINEEGREFLPVEIARNEAAAIVSFGSLDMCDLVS